MVIPTFVIIVLVNVITSPMLGPFPLRAPPLVESRIHVPPGVFFWVFEFAGRRRQRPFAPPRCRRIQAIKELTANRIGHGKIEELVVEWADDELVVT